MDESLIFYDFGMMGDIKSFTRERLLEFFYAVYEKDARKVCSRYHYKITLMIGFIAYKKSYTITFAR